MTVPLWILAFFAAVAGVMAISSSRFSLANWIDPVFGANLYQDHLTTATLWVLGILDAVLALVGVAVGIWLWSTRAERPASRPRSCEARGTSTSSTTRSSAGPPSGSPPSARTWWIRR